MLTVGDLHVSIAPVPGSVSDLVREFSIPAGHPLAAGDHQIEFFETDIRRRKDNFCSRVCSENEALMIAAAWLMCDETPESRALAEMLLVRYFGEGVCGWLLP